MAASHTVRGAFAGASRCAPAGRSLGSSGQCTPEGAVQKVPQKARLFFLSAPSFAQYHKGPHLWHPHLAKYAGLLHIRGRWGVL